MDNALPYNWTASKGHGTPGAQNENFLQVGVQSSPHVPTGFALLPNYPNPFNQSTTISYHLCESGFVHIAIYNITGQLVQTLINQKQQAGAHTVLWHAGNETSGVYFYRISAGNFSAIGKCVLLK